MKEKGMTRKEKRLDDQTNLFTDFLTNMELGIEDLRKYTIDSVHDESYRVLVSKPKKGLNIESFERFLEYCNWEIIRKEIDSEKEIFDIDDDLELPFDIPFEQVREGMVFLVSGDNHVEITELMRDQSKKLYQKLLTREHFVDRRRVQK